MDASNGEPLRVMPGLARTYPGSIAVYLSFAGATVEYRPVAGRVS